ncbi:hypothetical protein [Bacillus anthracis]|uniref:hypothetical protein n=1 Tax=Bacillus anthracis TaxID=1392 RepID=UPI00099C82B1|nr:hypothetical protein [Bacillus anthracis]OPD57618.1 hypothetical protein BVG01_18015 [Bacillus anthracis]
MKTGDFYKHYKGKDYFFDCIALPVDEFMGRPSELEDFGLVALDAHTPDGQEIVEVKLFYSNGVTFIDKDKAHVIYQAEEDHDTDKVWAREVDEFFGMVSITPFKTIRRFTKIDK